MAVPDNLADLEPDFIQLAADSHLLWATALREGLKAVLSTSTASASVQNGFVASGAGSQRRHARVAIRPCRSGSPHDVRGTL
jgi:hypothetical protein